MNTLAKSAPIQAMDLPVGEYWVRFHVEADSISFEVAASTPTLVNLQQEAAPPRQPSGFVQRWGGSARKLEDKADAWLTHINEKHLR